MTTRPSSSQLPSLRPGRPPSRRHSSLAIGGLGRLFLAVTLVAGAAAVALVLPAGPPEMQVALNSATGPQLR